LKAREALNERWMTNAEWPKSVACVALAYPLANPAIAAIIERVRNPWTQSIRAHLFPEAELLSVNSRDNDPAKSQCTRCHQDLPSTARYCPNCGMPVEASAPQ
jgi:hypothetical protein